MTDSNAIRAAIVALLESVPEIGRVHDYERYARDGNAIRAHYLTTIEDRELVRGWFVQRGDIQRARIGSGPADVLTQWTIRGFHGLDDEMASEKVFDRLVDAVVARFWDSQNLGITGVLTAVDGRAGLQVRDAGPVLFGSVLCHSARLIFHTRHTE